MASASIRRTALEAWEGTGYGSPVVATVDTLALPARHLAALSVVGLLAVPSAVRAEEGRVLGRDRLLHVGATFGLGLAGYGLGALASESLGLRLGLGLGLPLAAGLAKELADLAGLGRPDVWDLVADFVGAALGALVAWAVESAFEPRAGPRRRPRAPLGPGD